MAKPSLTNIILFYNKTIGRKELFYKKCNIWLISLEKNTVATPKPVDFPNLCANSMYILNNAYMLANGIKNSTIYHNGNSVISNSTIILYIGTIEAHPGLPAFLKIFHKLTIISIEARLPPINGNVPIDDVVDTPAE